MTERVLCSQCFTDQGLRLDALKIGIEDGGISRTGGLGTERDLRKKYRNASGSIGLIARRNSIASLAAKPVTGSTQITSILIFV
jgi:hypothetical protein